MFLLDGTVDAVLAGELVKFAESAKGEDEIKTADEARVMDSDLLVIEVGQFATKSTIVLKTL